MELRPHQLEAIEAINQNLEGIIHLPTGTGKTNIQAISISDNISNAKIWLKESEMAEEIPVFTILAPRILLSNQLFMTVRGILMDKNIDAQYLIVHSGRTQDDIERRKKSPDLPYRELKSTTKKSVVQNEYMKAKAEGVPLIIFGTYDSAERIIQAEIPVYMVCCDEAQYLVSREFGWIGDETEDDGEKFFPAYRKYYFTATLKETASDEGLGMNNSNKFGPIIYEKTPLEMIHKGEIIRPRIHLVNLSNSNDKTSDLLKDVNAIIESFKEHLINVNTGAKMLVIAKGSEHLNDIVSHPAMKNFLDIRVNMKIFDISSAYSPRINGVVVSREEFLGKLRGMTDTDEAIIFHINILTEGIDVQGITAIMPMNTMGLGKFLQTLGRATRLHPRDRGKLYNGILKWHEVEKFVKPYAWVIIPIYGIIGEDLKMGLSEIIYSLRSFGFKASEDVVIKEDKGKAMPQSLAGINQRDTKTKDLLTSLVGIEHTIEEQEEADRLDVEEFKENTYLKSLTFEESLKLF
jgi:superfamily II DNA or RNA helicase